MCDSAVVDASFSGRFHELKASDSTLILKILLREHKAVFESVKSQVDIGGGTGTMAKAVANTFPEMECTVLDRPPVVADLQYS